MSPRFYILLPLLAAQVPRVLTEVTWDNPAEGDVYTPGDTLQAIWTSPDKVVSPSFTICTGTPDNGTSTGGDPDCGTAVWPSVEQNGTEYSISLAVPNITGDGQYYLVMKDDAGMIYDTPNFSLALTKDVNSTANATAASSSSASEPTSTSVAYLPSHSGPTAAAIAIPLSLVAFTLVCALVVLVVRGRRSRRREKDKKALRDAEKMESRSRESAMSFASASEIERAVLALAATRGYGAPVHCPHPPSHMSVGGPFEGPGLGATAAAALGMGAFGWAHGIGAAAPTVPVMCDAYTPAPLPKYTTGPTAGSGLRSYAIQVDPGPALQTERTYYEPETAPREVNWRDTDWRGTDRMFADDPMPSAPPQPPAIQIHASSPPQHIDPPPPQQLLPGSPQSRMHHVYAHPYGPSPSQPAFASGPPLRPLQIPGPDADASLSVISNYLQPSPAMPQGLSLTPPFVQAPAFSGLRVPPASLTRVRSLRRLETVPGVEIEKPLPVRPEDRVGTDLYDAVSRAVGR